MNLPPPETRAWIARVFTILEDIVYIGLAVLLAGCALYLLACGAIAFAKDVLAGSTQIKMIELLDKILLILLIVELLYTVQVSFREHALVPEPFLLVGLISAVRRVLVLTAEFRELQQMQDVAFQNFIMELGVLTVLILALVFCLVLLRRKDVTSTAKRA